MHVTAMTMTAIVFEWNFLEVVVLASEAVVVVAEAVAAVEETGDHQPDDHNSEC